MVGDSPRVEVAIDPAWDDEEPEIVEASGIREDCHLVQAFIGLDRIRRRYDPENHSATCGFCDRQLVALKKDPSAFLGCGCLMCAYCRETRSPLLCRFHPHWPSLTQRLYGLFDECTFCFHDIIHPCFLACGHVYCGLCICDWFNSMIITP
ncbi:hypothetical protein F5Y16DRAFT_55176 [Xylariaceae sp. FL0255]|nr:hypothetical protein F5Y16DRAFT_55176 [Xylariaceae sp. FL0255]